MTLLEQLEEKEKAHNAARQRLFVYRKQENNTRIEAEKKVIQKILSELNFIKSQIKNG